MDLGEIRKYFDSKTFRKKERTPVSFASHYRSVRAASVFIHVSYTMYIMFIHAKVFKNKCKIIELPVVNKSSVCK